MHVLAFLGIDRLVGQHKRVGAIAHSVSDIFLDCPVFHASFCVEAKDAVRGLIDQPVALQCHGAADVSVEVPGSPGFLPRLGVECHNETRGILGVACLGVVGRKWETVPAESIAGNSFAGFGDRRFSLCPLPPSLCLGSGLYSFVGEEVHAVADNDIKPPVVEDKLLSALSPFILSHNLTGCRIQSRHRRGEPGRAVNGVTDGHQPSLHLGVVILDVDRHLFPIGIVQRPKHDAVKGTAGNQLPLGRQQGILGGLGVLDGEQSAAGRNHAGDGCRSDVRSRPGRAGNPLHMPRRSHNRILSDAVVVGPMQVLWPLVHIGRIRFRVFDESVSDARCRFRDAG